MPRKSNGGSINISPGVGVLHCKQGTRAFKRLILSYVRSGALLAHPGQNKKSSQMCAPYATQLVSLFFVPPMRFPRGTGEYTVEGMSAVVVVGHQL